MLKTSAVLILSATLTLAACGNKPAPESAPADLIFSGGHVLTEPGSRVPEMTALAVRGNRIIAVGSDETVAALAGPRTRTIDLAGAYVSPGFNDSHAHLYGLGKSLAQIDLMGTASAAEILALAAAAVADLPAGVWLEGRGWDQNDWSQKIYPTAAQLDAVTGDRPALLRRVDGHAAWANSAALRAAGITAATPDPEGGEILRDGTGAPAGVLIDNGVDLVLAVMPTPDPAEVERRVKLAVQHCWAAGVTGVHDAGVPFERAELYERLAAAGELGLRVYAMYADEPATLAAALARGPVFSADSLLTLRAVKLYGDGALGSRGALLLRDYSDQPGHRGLPVTSPAHLGDVIARCAAAGFQVCTHAIGDGANRLVLDLYESGLQQGGLTDARWRVEHAQILDPDDIPRFAQLGVIAAMQPTHCTSDMDWAASRLGDERLVGAYAWRSLVDSGAHVCFGTDFPVERVNPLHGLFAARTRTHADGTPLGGWQPQETLSGAEAHSLYTTGSAYAAFQENELGCLAPGFLADLVVLDGDPIDCAADDLLSMQVLHTVVNGRLVYSRENR